MRSMRPDRLVAVRSLRIPEAGGSIPALLLSPRSGAVGATGVLWLHGGYCLGMKEMVHASRAVDLVRRFGAVVLAPGYRLALRAPFPAALDVYHTDMHAFDMMAPDDPRSIEAIETFNRRFAAAQQRCFAPQS